VQLLNPLDLQPGAADAGDPGAHLHQEVGEVHHLGFHGGMLDDCLSPCEHRGHHQVLGPRVAWIVQVDAGAVQAFLRGGHVDAPNLPDAGPHGHEASDVHVHRPHTYGAAAGVRGPGLARAAEQGPNGKERGPHALHKGLGRRNVVDLGCLDSDGSVAGVVYPGSDRSEEFHHRSDVFDVGYVMDGAWLSGEQAGGHDRKGRVLGPIYLHDPAQGASALNDKSLAGPQAVAELPAGQTIHGLAA